MAESFIEKSIFINAPASAVWHTLTDDHAMRKWTNAFSSGAYAECDWIPGSEIIWRDRKGNIGARGIVVNSDAGRQLQIAYYDEDDIAGASLPGKYSETFHLTAENNGTTLSVFAGELDDEIISKHEPLWQKALISIKQIAERK